MLSEQGNFMWNSKGLQSMSINPFRPNPGRREKSKLNFYFHSSLWCLKRFYEDLQGLHKTFWGTTRKCENKNLTLFWFHCNSQKCTGRDVLTLGLSSLFKKPKLGNESTWPATVFDKCLHQIRFWSRGLCLTLNFTLFQIKIPEISKFSNGS